MLPPNHLATWVSRLVQIPSVTPAQAGSRAGTPGEGEIAAQIATWFQSFGGNVHQQEVLPGRPNIYGLWEGHTERWLAVDVHTDTVGVEQMEGEPFSGKIRDGRVYGRGAVDTKATLGIILALLETMHQRGLKPAANLLIAATIDEEIGTKGAPACADWIRQQQIPVNQLIVAEPTMCTPIYGHKGVARFEYRIHGQAAHSAQPELGQNAITAMSQVISALTAEHKRLQHLPPTVIGSPTLTVSLIQGGTGINVVPDHCHIAVDRRIVTNERAIEVATALYQLVQTTSPLPVTKVDLLMQDAFHQDPQAELVRHLAAWSGQVPETAPYGTNAWAYAGLDCECAIIGPGSIDQAHGAEEWISISELVRMTDIYQYWWGVSLT